MFRQDGNLCSFHTTVLFYHLQAILALLSVLTVFYFSHFAASFKLVTKERQSFHGSGATRALSSQGMICRASLAQFMVFKKTNSPTPCHPVSCRTVQVQCFFRQSSEKLSVSFCQGPEGTNRSDLPCSASRGTSIPAPSAHCPRSSTELLHYVVGVPVSGLLSWMNLAPMLYIVCLLDGPIICML